LIGLTCLTTNGSVLVPPKLNRRRAVFVLSKIDEILAWEKANRPRTGFEVCRTGPLSLRGFELDNTGGWTTFVRLTSFLERKFPESRRKAYYLMAIHEHLTPIRKRELELIGWTKARELAKVARRDRQGFDCAPWVHKAHTIAAGGIQAGGRSLSDRRGH